MIAKRTKKDAPTETVAAEQDDLGADLLQEVMQAIALAGQEITQGGMDLAIVIGTAQDKGVHYKVISSPGKNNNLLLLSGAVGVALSGLNQHILTGRAPQQPEPSQ